jgi:protoporphyrinogen oxidase
VKDDIIIVGGGPAGLAAGHEAVEHGARATVLERLDQVGGLARTIELEGNRWDIGPHRFYTKNQEVHSLFVQLVAEDLIEVPRLTRIFYNDRYFNYPLTPLNALFGVGVFAGVSAMVDYAAVRGRRALRSPKINNFEDWVVDKFGRGLYESFFKSYTEKVWGIDCTQIGADWAAQRIKGLSLSTAIGNALFKSKSSQAKTLVGEFVYPRLGAGQLYEKMAAGIERRGGRVITGACVRRIQWERRRIRAVTIGEGNGSAKEIEGRFFLASAPLTEMIEMMDPEAPGEVLAACRGLRYRNHVGVNLLAEGTLFPDNWIYVHSRAVGMARIASYRNFSPAMGREPSLNPLTVEYFAFPGDGVWNAPDNELIERAIRELQFMRILSRDQVVGSFVVRNEKAYPVMEIGYERKIGVIKNWLDQFDNLLPIGRSGMFKYNNQDHAMATGLLGARTALSIKRYDPWLVNIDAEYLEGAPAATGMK